MIEDGAIVAAGLVAERTGKPTFADAGRADDRAGSDAARSSRRRRAWRTAPCRARAAPSCRRPRRRPSGAGWRTSGELTSRLFSRSMASRSTISASRSSKASAAMSGCRRCSSSALAMPVSPSAIRRSWVGCVSIVVSFCLRASVVVATAADVGVPDRRAVRRVRVARRLCRARASGSRRSSRRCVAPMSLPRRQAASSAVRRRSSWPGRRMPRHDAEALLGMRLGLHDRLEQRDRRRADLGGLAHHPGRRPFGVAAVRARHVLGDRRVPVAHAPSAHGWQPAGPCGRPRPWRSVMRASTISRISRDGTE